MSFAASLGLRYPLIQAPMAGVQLSRLAIAVCEAGGLGSLPCAMLAPEAMRKELDAIRTGTSAPYNVNFFCHEPPAPSAERKAGWRKALGRFYGEFGIDPAAIPAGPGRLPFSAEAADVLEACGVQIGHVAVAVVGVMPVLVGALGHRDDDRQHAVLVVRRDVVRVDAGIVGVLVG